MPTAIQARDTFRRVVDLQAIIASSNGGIPTEIEILQVGVWKTPYHGDFSVAPQDLAEYKANFDEGVRAGSTLPIDYEHITDGGAAGWITGLTVKASSSGDGFDSLWASVEWTPPGAQALKDKVYKFFSPEFCPQYYVDPEDYDSVRANVLNGGAICTRPLFKKLKAVMASARSSEDTKTITNLTASDVTNTIYVNEGDKRVAQLDEVRKKKSSEITADDRTLLAANKSVLSAAEVDYFKLDEDPAKKASEDAAKKVADEKATADAEAKKASDAAAAAIKTGEAGVVTMTKAEVDALKASAERGVQAADKLEKAEIETTIKASIKRGAIKPDQLDAGVALVQASSPAQRKNLTDFLAALPDNKAITAGEIGSDKGNATITASDQLDKLAEELAAKEKISYGQAYRQVSASNPALAKQHANVLGDPDDDNDEDDE